MELSEKCTRYAYAVDQWTVLKSFYIKIAQKATFLWLVTMLCYFFAYLLGFQM